MLEPILTVKRADEAMSTYERVIPWFCFIPSKLSLKKQRHVNFRCREFDHCLGALSPSLCYHVIAEILWCDVLFSNVTLVVLGPRTWGNGRWYSYTALGGNILSKEKIVHSADIGCKSFDPTEWRVLLERNTHFTHRTNQSLALTFFVFGCRINFIFLFTLVISGIYARQCGQYTITFARQASQFEPRIT